MQKTRFVGFAIVWDVAVLIYESASPFSSERGSRFRLSRLLAR